MTTSTETVILKNGAEEAKPLVTMTMMTLNRLMDEGKSSTVYELVQLCRNGDHALSRFDGIAERLERLNLASEIAAIPFRGANKHGGCQWKVHDSVRNIVLSATEGEGAGIRLVNPVRGSGDQLFK